MSIEYIRTYYGVPAKRGGRVLFNGKPAVIIGTRNAYLQLKDEQGNLFIAHPTWEMIYLNARTK